MCSDVVMIKRPIFHNQCQDWARDQAGLCRSLVVHMLHLDNTSKTSRRNNWSKLPIQNPWHNTREIIISTDQNNLDLVLGSTARRKRIMFLKELIQKVSKAGYFLITHMFASIFIWHVAKFNEVHEVDHSGQAQLVSCTLSFRKENPSWKISTGWFSRLQTLIQCDIWKLAYNWARHWPRRRSRNQYQKQNKQWHRQILSQIPRLEAARNCSHRVKQFTAARGL